MNKKYIVTFALATSIMASPLFNKAEAAELSHTVQSGDTLWKISQQYKVSVEDMKSWNQLTSDTIKAGQTLIVSEAPQTQTTSYTVKAGDSLSLIAKIHNTTVNDIKYMNNLTSDLIRIGQVLQVPGQSSSVTPNVTQQAKTYTVQPGDSLWRIATNNGLTVDQLKSFNGLTSDILSVGQVLNLTAGQTPTPEVKKSLNVDLLLSEAQKHIGVPYVWGGNTTKGFDCSGFLNYVYAKAGVSIPRTVETIWSATTKVSSPQVGDLVFFTTYKAGPSHAGIYMGNNKFIHAGSSTGVTITDMNNSYWKARYLGAKKVNL